MLPLASKRLFPEHNGLLLEATGAGGIGLTVMKVVPATLVQPFTVTVTEYKPPPAVVILLMTGFCKAEENPFGPDQV